MNNDLISRESARMCLTGVIKEDMTISDFICRTDKRLREIPACEERPQGEWNYIQAGMPICPFCGAEPHKHYKNFCPNCGADMRNTEKPTKDQIDDVVGVDMPKLEKLTLGEWKCHTCKYSRTDLCRLCGCFDRYEEKR